VEGWCFGGCGEDGGGGMRRENGGGEGVDLWGYGFAPPPPAV